MKNVATIPPQLSFVHELAEGLWRQAESDPLKLAEMQVFLPTRRACRELRTTFLQLTGGRAALLPRLQPLGDIDDAELSFIADVSALDIPQAISPLRRQMLLIPLIQRKDPQLPIEQAALLADALAKLIDRVQVENLDFANLENLVAGDLAKHWQETLRFLEIITQAWPQVLQEEGNLLDPAERRNRLLHAQCAAWRKNPPSAPIIAAGSTGSMPAVAELLSVIATLPQGCVVLPGLDQDLDEVAWQAIEETHPQYGMKHLLEQMDLDRKNVRLWSRFSKETITEKRARLLQEAMRPAQTTAAWRNLKTEDFPLSDLKGLARITCDHPQEEAEVIALCLRATLEERGKTAMLVTPDRALAARVSASLQRWGIEANDSAGSSLPTLPIGSFLNAVLQVAMPHASAIDFLALLKHPLAACGISESLCRQYAREAEIASWRGLRRMDGLKGAEQDLRAEHPETAAWLETVAEKITAVTEKWLTPLPLIERLADHIALAEYLAATDESEGVARLWTEGAGEEAATWLNDWRQAAQDFPPLTGSDYQRLFQNLIQSVQVRPSYGAHARLNILGPLEARLQSADLVILGGMNEGVWPPQAEVDPWLSRPMQKDFGLPLPERRLGLSAHDFVQLAAAPQVLLTRAKRSGGSPTVPSRFLSQFEAVLQALGYHDKNCDALATETPWLAWARLLDRPETEPKAYPPPAPRPAVTLRPKKLSVTEIRTWLCNPYAIYAKHILKLRKLEPIDADVNAADRGDIVHKALENFLRLKSSGFTNEDLPKLLSLGQEAFAPYKNQPQVAALWWPRFARIATWFIEALQDLEKEGTRVLNVEAGGTTTFGKNGFTLYGRADRIDRAADGSVSLIDYKTALLPETKMVESGYEPQLPLLGLIALAGGFKNIAAKKIGKLSYWNLKGGVEIAKTKDYTKNVESLLALAQKRMEDLIDGYANSETPYLAFPRPRFRPRYDDYEHLSRMAEWSAAGGDE